MIVLKHCIFSAIFAMSLQCIHADEIVLINSFLAEYKDTNIPIFSILITIV